MKPHRKTQLAGDEFVAGWIHARTRGGGEETMGRPLRHHRYQPFFDGQTRGGGHSTPVFDSLDRLREWVALNPRFAGGLVNVYDWKTRRYVDLEVAA